MKTIDQLHRERPRNRFGNWSAVALIALVAIAWGSGVFDFGDLRTERAQRNFGRFITEMRPYPLQDRAWDWGIAAGWAGDQLRGKVGEALLATLAFSIAAMVIAGAAALIASLFAARNLAAAEPFLPGPRPPGALLRVASIALVWVTRPALILVRAVPEFVWAFILLTLLGPGAWAGVLALALHNTGILGKLFAEVTENADPRTPRALRGLGATRLQIATHALLPDSLNRFLLFFFYRWETCVREATVLGLLGFAGLGYYIQQANAALFWDRMLLWTLLGSTLIVAGDLFSALARRAVR